MPEPKPSLSEAVESTAAVLLKFVVPLYKTERGRSEPFGTGFFVHRDGRNFLVSAAHVLEGIAKEPLYYYVELGVLRKLTGKLLLTRYDGPREADHIDVGVLLLEGEHQPPYRAVDKFPMPFSYLKPELLPRSDKKYLFIGFPASRGKINPVAREVTAAPYAYFSSSTPEPDYAGFGFSPFHHILLPLNVRRGFALDGTPRAFPTPYGMSGSPIVLLYDEVNQNDPRIFPVVGVATTYLKQKHVIAATDIRAAVELISAA
jgi:hypothetical protein